MDTILEKAIAAERDVQTIKQNVCKCGSHAYVAENLFRTRYRVECLRCHNSSEWFPKIDDAVKEWNENNPKNDNKTKRQKLINKLKNITSDLENGFDGFLYLYDELIGE